MTRFLNPLAVAVSVVIAVALRQPMVGVLLISSVIVTMILCRSFPHLPWMILGAKLALVALVSFIAPKLWPQAGGLIPINPDQWFYVDTAERIAEALRASPFAVDYRGIVGLHNRLYSVVLGWLAFLNGGGSIILYRLFNVFVSLLLAAAAAALARSLYPSSPHIALIVFAGVALLPSVNAYALFVLRDVLRCPFDDSGAWPLRSEILVGSHGAGPDIFHANPTVPLAGGSYSSVHWLAGRWANGTVQQRPKVGHGRALRHRRVLRCTTRTPTRIRLHSSLKSDKLRALPCTCASVFSWT